MCFPKHNSRVSEVGNHQDYPPNTPDSSIWKSLFLYSFFTKSPASREDTTRPRPFSYSRQISLLYSAIVLSEEKYPAFAIFTIIFFAQLMRSV